MPNGDRLPSVIAFSAAGLEIFELNPELRGFCFDLAIDAAGRIIALTAEGLAGSDIQAHMRRYSSDGVIDEAFGDGGLLFLEQDLPDAANLAYEPGAERVVVCAEQFDGSGIRCGRFWL